MSLFLLAGPKVKCQSFVSRLPRSKPSNALLSSPEELKNEWFNDAKTIGICGATSTPQWLMEKIAQAVRKFKFH
jgi:4-hydroxy-3-methylbut-2-enyl diphosphate reductase